MLANNTLHKGMYNIMQEWYNYINENIHIQADLIGNEIVMSQCQISNDEISILSEWTWFLSSIYLVYLRTTPEVVYERMKVRGRSEETSVSLDYLKQLHDLHEDWLIQGRKYRPAPVNFINIFPHIFSDKLRST